MATARSIKDAVVDALAADVDIITKCLDYYDASPIITGGGSGRQGPETAPAFTVLAWTRTAGEDDDRRSFQLSVLLTLSDDTLASETRTVILEEGEDGAPDTTQDVTVENFAGPDRLEELLEYAATAILAISSEITVGDLEYSFEPLEFYPLFIGGLDFTISYPRLIGGYEPTIS